MKRKIEKIRDFMSACYTGKLSQAKQLLASFDTNEEKQSLLVDYGSFTAFHSACQNNRLNIVDWLLEPWNQESRPDMLAMGNYQSFRLACQNKFFDLAEKLFSSCDDKEQLAIISSNPHESFTFACAKGYMDVIRLSVQHVEKCSEWISKDDYLSFCIACENGHYEVVLYLLSISDRQEKTAMLTVRDALAFGAACQQGHMDVATLILSSCANHEERLSVIRAKEYGPFLGACMGGHLGIAQWLLTLIDDEEQSSMFSTRSHNSFSGACSRGHLGVAQWLLKLSIDDKEQSSMFSESCYGAFFGACMNDHLNVAQWVLSLCQDDEERIKVVSFCNYNAFRVACEQGHLDLAKWLCGLCQTAEEKEAMLHGNDRGAFRNACHNGHFKVVQWLLESCSDHHDKNAMISARQYEAFLGACKNGHLKIVKELCSMCSNKKEMLAKLATYQGYCVFDYARRRDYPETVKYLLSQLTENDRLDIFKYHFELWPELTQDEQMMLIKEGYFSDQLITTIINNHTLFVDDVFKLVRSTTSTVVREALDLSLYVLNFRTIIDKAYDNNAFRKVFSMYVNDCLQYNKDYFLDNNFTYLCAKTFDLRGGEVCNNVLNDIDPFDLLNPTYLNKWLSSLDSISDRAMFAKHYQAAVWRQPLYDALERGFDEIEVSSLIAVIRVLFEHQYFTIQTLIERINIGNQLTDQCIWVALCQEAVMEIMEQQGCLTQEYQLLWESFCVHPLNLSENNVMVQTSLKIIGWFEQELNKQDDAKLIWSHDQIWHMMQSLGLGIGIMYQDTPEERMRKLQLKKRLLSSNHFSLQANNSDITDIKYEQSTTVSSFSRIMSGLTSEQLE